jgi:hypothetical protein
MNKTIGKICLKQVPSTEWIRKANQHLQACFDRKRVLFASNIRTNFGAFEAAINSGINLELIIVNVKLIKFILI